MLRFAAANSLTRISCGSIPSKAQAAPGVVAVFSADDLAGDYKPIIPFSRMPNYYATPILALASNKVRYVGEAVVAVIAEDRYLAEDALELIDIEYAPLGGGHRSRIGGFRGSAALHEEAATNVLIAREFGKGDVRADLATAACSRPRSLRDDAKSPAGDRAAQLFGRIRRPARCDHALHVLEHSRHRSRRAGGIARSARHPAAGDRARCRRQFWFQGLALSRRNPAVRGGKETAPVDQVDRRSAGGHLQFEPGLCRDHRSRDGVRRKRHRDRARSRRDRRRRRLFDLSLDLRARTGPGRQLPSRSLQDQVLPGRRARRRHQQAADRTLSRRRTADFHLRRRAADGYGRPGARDRSARDSPAQSRSIR